MQQLQTALGSHRPVSKSLYVLAGLCGVVQILLVVLSVLFQMLLESNVIDHYVNRNDYDRYYSDTAQQTHFLYFSPLLWFISGCAAIVASCSKHHYTIVVNLITNIMSTATIVHYIPIAAVVLHLEKKEFEQHPQIYLNPEDFKFEQRNLAYVIMILMLAIVEGFMAITSITLCYPVLRSNCNKKSTQYTVLQNESNSTGQANTAYVGTRDVVLQVVANSPPREPHRMLPIPAYK